MKTSFNVGNSVIEGWMLRQSEGSRSEKVLPELTPTSLVRLPTLIDQCLHHRCTLTYCAVLHVISYVLETLDGAVNGEPGSAFSGFLLHPLVTLNSVHSHSACSSQCGHFFITMACFSCLCPALQLLLWVFSSCLAAL